MKKEDNQARKKSTKINFFGSEKAGWGGGLPPEGGGGRKVRALPRKFLFLAFRREESGMSREFCRHVPTPGGVQKVCAKRVCAHFSFPNYTHTSVTEKNCHRVLEGAPPRGRQLYFTFPGAPDPLFKASKAPFLALRVATPSGHPVKDRLKLFPNY